ncbi:hypothetical protein [Streptomyces morookaense]|uniref:Secreted protein n=1 Tax=Streptomyces morookaense TaxID=1970 RepID=A0A7Y7E6S5_STRMO|nr:hypothetical protein [Streptomyces morookaense]NVK78258.1 hypothetical protein [Streptomyces morookaense]GHF31106.1 hypothetical protein GCM10010359_36600 [Streptomyces morookaense]
MTDHTYPRRNVMRAAAAGALTAGLFCLTPLAQAAQAPAPPPAAGIAAAHNAAAAPSTLDTLSRFFTRDGAHSAVARSAVQPRIEGATVPVYTLSPEFVAGKADAPVAKLEYLASTAVSSDGQKASVWTVRSGGSWKVVNIATGDDETRYAAEGAKKLSGGTVFREPQINAWYVQRGDRVLPLDQDAVRAVGTGGTTVAAYRDRVHKAYGDKLPGSAYAEKGFAGGYGEAAAPAAAERGSSSPGLAPVAAAGGAALVLGLGAVTVRRVRRRPPVVRG